MPCPCCKKMSNGKFCCIACVALVVIGFYVFFLVYLPISMEYSQTKRFRESVCGVVNVTVFCDQKKLCTCEETNLDPCAKIEVKFYEDPNHDVKAGQGILCDFDRRNHHPNVDNPLLQCPPGRDAIDWDDVIVKYRKILILKQNFTCFIDVENPNKYHTVPILDDVKYTSSFMFHLIFWPVLILLLPIGVCSCLACFMLMFLLYDYYGPTMYDIYDNCRRKLFKRRKRNKSSLVI